MTLLLLALLAVGPAEDLAVPSFQRPDLLQFKVKQDGVASISVLATTYARDGRVDRQIFELTPQSDRGAFPESSGWRMWESDKIAAARQQWRGNPQNIDRIEFSYVVHAGADGQQRTPIESANVYAFGGIGSSFRAVGRNPGRGLDRLDPAEVQAAVDRLAAHPPDARFVTLPGGYPHPLHPENELVHAIRGLTRQKQAHPERNYFIRVSVYNHDSVPISQALVDAHAAGVKVELISDFTQVTPRLASKPAYEMLRSAGIPLASMVRASPLGHDIRTNHTKIWILGQLDGRGRIVEGSTYDCSFNTEFGNYPANQEAMTVFASNRDVATVYNHLFQAMKGNAPLRLVVDPARAKFALTHPLYPNVTPDGHRFGSREAMFWFIGKAKHRLTMLDYVHADPDIARATGEAARRGARVDVFLNGWKVHNDGGPEGANILRSLGANVHLVHHSFGGSPVHHKSGVADDWVRGGSLNPGWWSFESDETMYVMRSPRLAREVMGAANRLAQRYPNEQWGGSQPPPEQLENVQFEARLPRGVDRNDVRGVYFVGGGSRELDGKPVELKQAPGQNGVYRGSRQLPTGLVHKGKPMVELRDGSKRYSEHDDTYFTVTPRSSGRQRIRTGFKGR